MISGLRRRGGGARPTTRERERAPYTFFEWKSRLKLGSSGRSADANVQKFKVPTLSRKKTRDKDGATSSVWVTRERERAPYTFLMNGRVN